MTRSEYLQALDRALRPFALRKEREEILRYYAEYFDEAGPEGEAEIIAQLGDPKALARASMADRAPGDEPSRGLARLRELPVLGKLMRLPGRTWLAVLLAVLLVGGTTAGAAWYLWLGMETYTKPFTLYDPVFDAVQIDMPCANVELLTGRAYAVSVSWNEKVDYEVRCGVRDGVLRVESTVPAPVMPADEFDCVVRITVPGATVLKEIQADLDVGSVKIGAQTMVNLLTLERMGISTGNGEVLLSYVDVTEELSVYTGRGNILYRGFLGKTTALEASMGDVEIHTQCPLRAIDYDLRVDDPGSFSEIRVGGLKKKGFQAKTDRDRGTLVDLTAVSGGGKIRLEEYDLRVTFAP